MEKALFAVDELTGLVAACALVRPSRSVMDLTAKSVKKKWKEKRFAAGVDRDIIDKGAEMLGMERSELIAETIAGMREVAEAIGLAGGEEAWPYIPQPDRPQYEQAIADLVGKLTPLDDNDAKGHLNYVIYSIVKRYLEARGMRYFRAQDFIGGVLSCCQMECYRRLLAPYEDKAIEKNGDV